MLTSCLDTYSETVNLVIDNYRKVAQEFGVVLAPSALPTVCAMSEKA